jgi:hypothetical protein
MTDVRASDAERDATVERLRDAAGEGRLTLEELADRIDVATRAVTRGELAALLADLPGASPAVRVDAAPVRALGDVKRSGAWVVPAETRYRSWLGHIKLDLREARISQSEVHIHAWALFGTIDLLVPEGVEVDVQARAHMCQIKQEAGGVATPGMPRIVLTGGTWFGEIKVRHRRLWEKLARKVLERG